MNTFENRIRLQKLIYILNYYGIKFPYNFTWWKHGPYSPRLADDGYATNDGILVKPSDKELRIVERVRKGKRILENSGKAELVASYLYLKDRLRDRIPVEIEKELIARKSYLSYDEVQQVMNEWRRAVDT